MEAINKIRKLVGGAASLAALGMVFPVDAIGAAPKEGYRGAAGAEEEMVAGFIVKVNQNYAAKLDEDLQKHDATTLSRVTKMRMVVARRMSNNSHVVNVSKPIPLSEARIIAARMMKESGVELAEPDRFIHAAATTPADPAYTAAQWHYKTPSAGNHGGINLPAAWDFTLGSGVTVAVLDTGYRGHEDLKTVLKGYDFITNPSTANDGNGRDSDPQDPGDWVSENECGNSNEAKNSSWHGTHVMGTISALMNNGKGGTGVAPNVKILPLRVLGKCGGKTSDIVDAMRWAAGLSVPGVEANRNPARILNMSLGAGGACSVAFQSAVDDVVKQGAMIVASAGNDHSTSVSQPANCSGVLAVTAHAVNGDNANYANIGPEIFISAPGGGCGTVLNGSCDSVYSTWNSGTRQPGSNAYAYMNGTSMAAPHVAGTIALMLSIKPILPLEEVKSYLQASARAHPAGSTCLLPGNVNKCGAGLLDAGSALTKMVTGSTQSTTVISSTSQVTAPRTMVTLSGSAFVSSNFSANLQTLSYQWTPSPNNPSPVTLTNADQLEASFTAPEKGVYIFMLEVKDGGASIGKAVAIVRINTAPRLNTIGAQTVEAGKELQFLLSGTDADGDPLIFHPISLPSGASLSPDGFFSWPDATPVGTYEVTYYASDYDEDSSSGKTTITVSASSGGGGGGGGMDDWSLAGLLLMSFYLRFRRIAQAKDHAKPQH